MSGCFRWPTGWSDIKEYLDYRAQSLPHYGASLLTTVLTTMPVFSFHPTSPSRCCEYYFLQQNHMPSIPTYPNAMLSPIITQLVTK